MRHVLLPIFALLTSVAFLLTANGLLGVLLPTRALAQGFNSIDIGIMGTAYFGGFFVGCLLGPRLVRRVGHIRTFAALTSSVCILALVHGLFDERLVWWLARGVTGICFAALYVVIESWLSEKSTNDNRGVVFSIYTIVTLTVITIGQLAITLMSTQGFALFALAAILISMATIPVAISIAPAPAHFAASRMRLSDLLQRSRVAVIGCLGIGMANGAFWTLAPVFAELNAGNTNTVAIFMSLTVIAGAFGQWPLGRLSDRVDRRRVIAGASIAAAFGAIVLVGTPPTSTYSTYLGAMIFGTFAFPLYALCAAHLNDFVETDGYVEAASGLLMTYSVGAIVGPLIASALMAGFGAKSLFVYTASIHAAVAVYAIYRLRQHEPAVATERASFSDALAMVSMSAEIDPRQVTEELK